MAWDTHYYSAAGPRDFTKHAAQISRRYNVEAAGKARLRTGRAFVAGQRDGRAGAATRTAAMIPIFAPVESPPPPLVPPAVGAVPAASAGVVGAVGVTAPTGVGSVLAFKAPATLRQPPCKSTLIVVAFMTLVAGVTEGRASLPVPVAVTRFPTAGFNRFGAPVTSTTSCAS